MQSTRGWWSVLGSFALIFLANIRLAFSEKDSEGKVHTEEARQHLCCARHEKMIDVGYENMTLSSLDTTEQDYYWVFNQLTPGVDVEGDGTSGISGEVIQIDIGHCRKLCPRYVSDDPGDASKPAVQRCSQEGHCRPRAARLERVSTLQGVRIIEAVDACECSSDSSCKRESYTHLIHSGTPYQVVIDVGVCIGHCGKDLGCKPVRNNTVSVKGPNGDEVYPVIERCSCVGNCHRMDHMETVLDFSEVEIKEGTNTTDVKPVVRQINVGQCVGACPGNETETCLLRDKREPSRCLAGLYSKQHTCTPARFKVHEYRTRRGSKREVIQIIQCICV
uniref:Uncharacterized protein n=1 Tax=Vespula pensylvanica TaxID=30213 RepID=A0A834NZC5_VESPE|nr:hypothetical protein H0235_009662 [Vespula pensylvanica]